MGMFDVNPLSHTGERSASTLKKLERVTKALYPSGAGPGADQRFLLGRFHQTLAGGT